MDPRQLRISYLFGAASVILGLVFVAATMLNTAANPGRTHAEILYHASSIDAVCAVVEAALGVLIICFEKRGKKTALIPFAFALLFTSSAALNLRSASAPSSVAPQAVASPNPAQP